MVRFASLYVVVMMTLSCRAQLPIPAVTTPHGISPAIEQRLVQIITQGARRAYARAVYDTTMIPVAVSHVIRALRGVPPIINDNITQQTEMILAEYRAGLRNEDAKLSIDQLIAKYGFPVEKHNTTTEDGYVLQMYRIPGNGSTVFLMHGLFSSSDDFVIGGPESGLAYLLAQEGYDVWMGNARGSKHSRHNIKLDPHDAAFWDFSWHEIGYYDLPAMIDYVLNATNQKTLKYIGHSQGTTSFFVMGSERPEYNDKIALMVAMSPGAYMSRARSPFLRIAAPISPFLGRILQILGIYELLADNTLVRVIKAVLCGAGPIAEIICYEPMLLANGIDITELNVTNLPVILGHTPNGASVKQLLHYGQSFNSRDFRLYDHGPTKNLQIYGSEVPPRYSLQNVRAPISLFYSENDWMAHPDDVKALYKNLGNPVDIYKVPHPAFDHMDFVWAKHFRSLIYNRIRKLLTSY